MFGSSSRASRVGEKPVTCSVLSLTSMPKSVIMKLNYIEYFFVEYIPNEHTLNAVGA